MIQGNAAYNGGGIYCQYASPIITNNQISENTAINGCGIYCDLASSPRIENNHIFNNLEAEWKSYGGGIYCTLGSMPHIQGNVFEGNIVGYGGAISCNHASKPFIANNLFMFNNADRGGALDCAYGAKPLVVNCTFYKNYAQRNGGALALWNGSAPWIGNNIIVESTMSGGVYCNGSYPAFICNDTWDNLGGNYTGGCIDPTGTNGNISANPLFCAPEAGNFMLQNNSPCAPENSPGCDGIGALGVGCGATSVETITWGRVKALHR